LFSVTLEGYREEIMDPFPEERIVRLNNAPVNREGEFVLYWMTAFRRARWNFSLDRAVCWARELNKPLVVLEGLRCDYQWASERHHSFILNGMRDNQASFENTDALYFPFVERFRNEGKGLLNVLASRACIVIADECPIFFLPRMVRAASRELPVGMEAVDSNGLLPIGITDRVFLTAHSFRRFLQLQLPRFLEQSPEPNPFSGAPIPRLERLPAEITRKWPVAPREIIDLAPGALEDLPIDHGVGPVKLRGGAFAAGARLREFLEYKLERYHRERNHPDEDVSSGLSPYLHFGHISVHEIFRALAEAEHWTSVRLFPRASGQREGWWGMSEGGEAFLDQLITWREIGFNMCSKRDDYDRFESLPLWAREELAAHEKDARAYLYTLEEFETARTHDPLWNAAQRQLLLEGCMHNYLRMLWGKKILEWTSSPRQALEVMIELNNKYALDGRDPNSYTGIFWVLGRYDRPFGPARPIFGKIRYMSSGSVGKRIRLKEYLRLYGGG